MGHALTVTLLQSFNLLKGQRLKCCNVDFEHFHPECYPIKIAANDPFYGKSNLRCQEYARSATATRTGCTLGPREQINQVRDKPSL